MNLKQLVGLQEKILRGDPRYGDPEHDPEWRSHWFTGLDDTLTREGIHSARSHQHLIDAARRAGES